MVPAVKDETGPPSVHPQTWFKACVLQSLDLRGSDIDSLQFPSGALPADMRGSKSSSDTEGEGETNFLRLTAVHFSLASEAHLGDRAELVEVSTESSFVITISAAVSWCLRRRSTEAKETWTSRPSGSTHAHLSFRDFGSGRAGAGSTSDSTSELRSRSRVGDLILALHRVSSSSSSEPGDRMVGAGSTSLLVPSIMNNYDLIQIWILFQARMSVTYLKFDGV